MTDPARDGASDRPEMSDARGTADERDRRDLRVLLAVVVWFPLAVIAVATTVLLLWIPRLPAEVAVHFDASGEPDRWATPIRAVLAYLAISLAVGVSLALATLAGRRSAVRPADGARPRLLPRVRPTAVFAPATSVLIAFVTLALTGVQLDDATPPSWAAPVAVGGGILSGALVGWITWRLLPAPEPQAAPAATPALTLAPGERAVWSASLSAPWIVIVIVGSAAAFLVVPLVVAPAAWWLWGVLLLVVIVLATTTGVRVTVDRRGLTVRTLLGLRLTRVALDEVVSAADVEVLSAEFGGWGFRLDVRGRRGIIMRQGSGIEVQRTDSPPLVVTVPDARTGAALLNALAAGARPAG
ncbi:DUF1648 domain-containing protein [Agromyces sp. GXQ0307]|uniref:DUF1648 domain-containing protein n=1 Tax=Agromyces sp. GXQ0307 TaxID=3377835 RepID=UPI00383AC904